MQNNTKIAKNSASVSALVLFGKALGFIKQSIIAWAFGSTGFTDLFNSAEGFVAMFIHIIGNAAEPTVLTSFIQLKENGKETESKQLISDCYGLFLIISIVIIGVVFLFSSKISNIIGLSYSLKQKEELKLFMIILSPSIALSALRGVSIGYLDSENMFLSGRLSTLFYSICMIISVLVFKELLGYKSLLLGFLLGYFTHSLTVLYIVLHRIGIRIPNPFKNNECRSILKRIIPIAISISVVDIGHLVDKIIASSLVAGSVSSLSYGQVASSDIVHSVLISSIGAVLFPHIARSVASENISFNLINHVKQYLSFLTFLTGCITVFYLIEGYDLIRFIYERGNFTKEDTSLVFSVAANYSIGFVFLANRDILVKTHYAFQDTFSPMLSSVVGVCVNLILSIILSKTYGVSGIALATSISLLVNCIILIATLKKHLSYAVFDRNLWIENLKTFLCMVNSLIMGCIVHQLLNNINYIIRMIIVSITILLVFILIGKLLKSTAIKAIRSMLIQFKH